MSFGLGNSRLYYYISYGNLIHPTQHTCQASLRSRDVWDMKAMTTGSIFIECNVSSGDNILWRASVLLHGSLTARISS